MSTDEYFALVKDLQPNEVNKQPFVVPTSEIFELLPGSRRQAFSVGGFKGDVSKVKYALLDGDCLIRHAVYAIADNRKEVEALLLPQKTRARAFKPPKVICDGPAILSVLDCTLCEKPKDVKGNSVNVENAVSEFLNKEAEKALVAHEEGLKAATQEKEGKNKNGEGKRERNEKKETIVMDNGNVPHEVHAQNMPEVNMEESTAKTPNELMEEIKSLTEEVQPLRCRIGALEAEKEKVDEHNDMLLKSVDNLGKSYNALAQNFDEVKKDLKKCIGRMGKNSSREGACSLAALKSAVPGENAGIEIPEDKIYVGEDLGKDQFISKTEVTLAEKEVGVERRVQKLADALWPKALHKWSMTGKDKSNQPLNKISDQHVSVILCLLETMAWRSNDDLTKAAVTRELTKYSSRKRAQRRLKAEQQEQEKKTDAEKRKECTSCDDFEPSAKVFIMQLPSEKRDSKTDDESSESNA